MVYIISCKKCAKEKPDVVIGDKTGTTVFGYIQNHGIFYCPHVNVFERVTVTKWKRKQ